MVLPNFAVIGAAKSGTTALYQWLRQHPDVFMPAAMKETNFFAYDPTYPPHAQAHADVFPVRTLAQYEALFAAAGDAVAIGEATAGYLDLPQAAERMAAVIPGMQLIVSLRDPVSRVWSHAQMSVRMGWAPDLEAEVRRLAASDEQEYAPKFRHWLRYFPRDQFHILLYDDLESRPIATAQGMYRFLQLRDFEPDVAVRYNPGGLPRSALAQRLIEVQALRRFRPIAPMAAFNLVAKLRAMNLKPPPPLDPRLRRTLTQRYRPDLIETQELLGVDLSAWVDGETDAA